MVYIQLGLLLKVAGIKPQDVKHPEGQASEMSTMLLARIEVLRNIFNRLAYS